MKKKSILACGLALILLAGCAQRDEGAGEAPREEPPFHGIPDGRGILNPRRFLPNPAGEFSFGSPKKGFPMG